ncbi:hypothetical protein CMUST_15720 (plasmid) [Corynebacterium mustelae]|uniref:Phage major tail protein, phi13 family n=1 Tax=Corynebacterium mustelae TaxID=571915 RepID=A0A0G3H8E2_9CORY|nr:hypothetical protein [Corynebacterium mustelae]AKK05242.1 hypothetical protein CMUST_04500 [Corynebacterium mustelae]AKK07432.1 hypothetical protein CMUST_15720 [Corynebacterium mustelae]
MAVNVANAFVGAPPIDGGVFYSAPLGTKLPTTALEKLNTAFVDHGAVSENGFSVKPTRNSTTEKMFGGGDFIALQTDYGVDIEITFMEDDNDAVIKTAFGDASVVEKAATSNTGKQRTIYYTDEPLPVKSYVLKAISGAKSKTYVAERAQVISVEKTPDVHNATTKTTVKLKAYKSTAAELRGAYVVELRDDGVHSG